jgi:pyruvate kinase
MEAEAYLEANPRAPDGAAASLTELVDPIARAAVDAAYLMTEQLDAALVVVATDSGRTALGLSNRRPSATIFALTRTEDVARALSLCWGVTALVLPETPSSEHVLAYGIEWAKSHGLVSVGQHAVLLRGDIDGHPDVQAVLAGTIN